VKNKTCKCGGSRKQMQCHLEYICDRSAHIPSPHLGQGCFLVTHRVTLRTDAARGCATARSIRARNAVASRTVLLALRCRPHPFLLFHTSGWVVANQGGATADLQQQAALQKPQMRDSMSPGKLPPLSHHGRYCLLLSRHRHKVYCSPLSMQWPIHVAIILRETNSI